jgi:hypothetical protein
MHQAQLFSLWGISDELTNHFEGLINPNYNTTEISALLRDFERSAHPISLKIQLLLKKVIEFRSGTNPDFKKTRNESKTSPELLEIFNTIGDALEVAKSECAKETKNSDAEVIFNRGIAYAITSIEERLENLSKEDNQLFAIYTRETNKLKTTLQTDRHQPAM